MLLIYVLNIEDIFKTSLYILDILTITLDYSIYAQYDCNPNLGSCLH